MSIHSVLVSNGTSQFVTHLTETVFAITLFFLGTIVIKKIRTIASKSMKKANVEKGVSQFVDSLLRVTLYIVLVLLIMTEVGIETTSIAAILASSTVTIGLAIQKGLSNLVGGLLILFLKPFTVGDYIITNDQEGTVEEIQVFYTKLLTEDSKTIIIPNGTLSNVSTINASRDNRRTLEIRLEITKKHSVDEAKSLIVMTMLDEANISDSHDCSAFISSVKKDTITIIGRCKVRTEDYYTAKRNITEKLNEYIEDAIID